MGNGEWPSHVTVVNLKFVFMTVLQLQPLSFIAIVSYLKCSATLHLRSWENIAAKHCEVKVLYKLWPAVLLHLWQYMLVGAVGTPHQQKHHKQFG
jgi:F0F1-type ATP synthase membrane subunit a